MQNIKKDKEEIFILHGKNIIDILGKICWIKKYAHQTVFIFYLYFSNFIRENKVQHQS